MSAASAGTQPAAGELRTPEEVLTDLGVSARALFDVFVMNRRDDVRERLAGRVELVVGAGDLIEEGALSSGDLLVRGAHGESIAIVSVLVNGELLDRRVAEASDLEPEAGLPGRYAWVVESGARPHPREDRFARRISDGRGYVPTDQALLRVAATTTQARAATTSPTSTAAAEGSLEETVNRRSSEYTRWYQDALNRIDGARLTVDGVVGPLTRAAVRRYQARKGLAADGIVGPITEGALVRDGAVPPPGSSLSPAGTVTFDLLVDGDRDGMIDASPGTSQTWAFGAAGRGAVVLVNNNDDGIDGAPDNENAFIDTGNDRNELAPIRIAPAVAGPAPAGTTLELIVDRPDALRIFSSGNAGGTELVGPATGASHRFASPPTGNLDLAMEGVRYAGPGFDGEVQITLRTTDPGGARTEQKAAVRVAPWIMANHKERAEKVFVVDAGAFNRRFRTELGAIVAAAGARLVESASGDIWMQDCMEFGSACVPRVVLRSVLRAPRDRPLRTFPRSLLGTEVGYTEQGSITPFTTFDSSGNLEATPPFTAPSGKRFPFGRIYFGPGRSPLEAIDAGLQDFLHKQIVQAPIQLETGWLTVGHVDEVLSFVPAPGTPGFKMLIASPRRGYAILDAVNAATPSARLLTGRTFPLSSSSAVLNLEQTVSAFLALRSDFHPDLRAAVAAGFATHTPKPLRDYNTDRQADIDRIRASMATELGLRDTDVVEIPAILMPNTDTPQTADAMVAGMVNMLVVNSHCVIPKPFGPRSGTPAVDRFEDDVTRQLAPLGLTVHFLDCWDEYHVNLGEVHCATNVLRRAAPTRWWEFQP